MLAMIEINLLPQEFRPSKGTNLPLMLTVAVGMLVVGGLILFNISLNNELGQLTTEHKDLTVKRDQLLEEVKKVKDLRQKIARQKARQDTIIEISQSKIMWSLKLQQFSEIMRNFPNFWIQRLQLSKSAASALQMEVSAAGSNLREVARFRDALKNDPNFYYHFADLQSQDIRIDELKNMNFPEKMDFRVSLPLRTWHSGGGRRK